MKHRIAYPYVSPREGIELRTGMRKPMLRAVAVVVLLALGGLAAGIAAMSALRNVAIPCMAILLVEAAVFAVAVSLDMRLNTCPKCRQWLRGRIFARACPHCAAQLHSLELLPLEPGSAAGSAAVPS